MIYFSINHTHKTIYYSIQGILFLDIKNNIIKFPPNFHSIYQDLTHIFNINPISIYPNLDNISFNTLINQILS